MTPLKEYCIWVNIPMRDGTDWWEINDKIAQIMAQYGDYDGGGTDFDTRDIVGYVRGKVQANKCAAAIKAWMAEHSFRINSIEVSLTPKSDLVDDEVD